jgi:hypothetical protein
VSFAAITLCVTSQRVFIVVSVYFVIDSVRKLLDTLVLCTVKEGCQGSLVYKKKRGRRVQKRRYR